MLGSGNRAEIQTLFLLSLSPESGYVAYGPTRDRCQSSDHISNLPCCMRCLSSRNRLQLRAVCQGVKEVPVSASGVSMGRNGCLREAGAVGHGRLRRVGCVLQVVGATEGL